ncbi:hypothetical protein BKA64DRAFT_754787 [Cadophora sp. MPI-SDFR-AT-0126]|nr:hypothetical protein BKA64DRAFT_754787 [Leotiomycetes sp. MPI-SDFR-AT-0126]
MHLPPVLPAKLETCTMKFSPTDGEWAINGIVPLLTHPFLRHLEMHSGLISEYPILFNVGDKFNVIRFKSPKSSPLESLTLADFNLTAHDLQGMLRYPKALQYLSVCTKSSSNNYDIPEDNYEYIDCETAFYDIARAVGKSLLGFRYEVDKSQGEIITAASLYRFKTLRYLEVQHPLLAPLSPWFDAFGDPSVAELLPPKFEVLKIVNFVCSEKGLDIIDKILENKDRVVPSFRRIFLLIDYADAEMESKLRALAKKAEYSSHALDELMSCSVVRPDSVREDELDTLKGKCKAKGIELMFSYEHVLRKELLVEWVGRAVWEIPELIA